MADNVTFTAGANSTPPANTLAATDELSDGSHAGIAKLAISADGDRTFIPATAADGLLVNLGTNNDVTITSGVDVLTFPADTVSSGNLTAPAQTVALSVDNGITAVGVQVTGVYTGQLEFEVSVDGVNYEPHDMIYNATDAVVNATTGTGIFFSGVSAFSGFRVRASALSAGTATVTIRGSVGTESVHLESPLPAGDNNIGNVDVASLPNEGQQTMANSISVAVASDQSAVPVSAATLPLPTGAATAALQLPDGHNVTVDNGAGAAAVNIQDGGNVITVDGTVSVTEPVSVDDNGGSLTVDAPLATPVHTRISDGTDVVNVSATGALQVDGSAVTQPVSVSSLPNEGQQTMANSISVAVASDQSALTVAQATAANLNAQVVGTAAHASPASGNPVYVAGRASTAVPTDVGADGDAAGIWLSRNGAPVVTMAPHVGLMGLPWTMTSETAQYSTTQTSTVLVAGGASDRIVVTSIQIQAGGTTAGTLQVYFGTGAYARGTNLAIFDGEFAPSATLKPGVVMQGPFISPTNGDDILVTDSAAINPLTITVWYYVVV